MRQWRGVRRPSVCKLLRKWLLLADKWPDRHQSFTRWTPGQRASRVCSRIRNVKGHVIRALFWILGMSYSVIDGLVCFRVVQLSRRLCESVDITRWFYDGSNQFVLATETVPWRANGRDTSSSLSTAWTYLSSY